MIGVELPVRTADEACRVIKALGAHRYVAGRLLAVHALALEGAGAGEASAWAETVLADRAIDPASRDERLVRACTEADVAAVVARYWGAGDASERAREALAERLDDLGLEVPDPEPFDETREDEVFPALIDAGWEALRLGELDPERHKGAIAAYGEFIAFESARFEEQESMPPKAHLYELPLFGPRELLEGTRDGELLHPFVVYLDGDETYLDYVMRGVIRAAKLPTE